MYKTQTAFKLTINMKKTIALALMVAALFGCGKETDLSGIEKEIADLQNKNQQLQDEINKMKEPVPEDPVLQYLNFWAEDNPVLLSSDVKGEIIGDSIVECWVPNVMDDKQLVADFKFVGENVKFNGSTAQSRKTKYDFKKPVKLTVTNQGKSKEYTVYVHAFTGLPVVWIETAGRQEIVSREEYVSADFRLVEDVRTRAAGDVIETTMQIKGRGNSNWAMPKKPYRLKLEKEFPLLGEHKDKAWVLIGNYTDKTMLRNSTAFYMGAISNLEYTPKAHFVEVMLNGRYNGTYLLCEKLKRSKHRVNVGDDGFLLEVDAVAREDEPVFRVGHLKHPVNIKSPSVEVGDENYNYIRDFVLTAENALFSDNFKDATEGWQKYMDMDSFVDWYLINEIARNNDALLYSSCYMNLTRGGKLKMGPIWDYDIAFGNINYNNNFKPEGFWVKTTTWYTRLFEDPAFVEKVKERFNFFYSHKEDIFREMNENAVYLSHAVVENENRWGTLYTETWPNYDIWGNYNNEVQLMKEWITARFEWLNYQFNFKM